jgi:hypothetical protein
MNPTRVVFASFTSKFVDIAASKHPARLGGNCRRVLPRPEQNERSYTSRVPLATGRGADRLIVRSIGVEHVWVNGVATRVAGEDLPDVAPGQLLRS